MSEIINRMAEAIVNRRREMAAAKGGPIFVEPLELARAALEEMRPLLTETRTSLYEAYELLGADGYFNRARDASRVIEKLDEALK